MSQHQPKEVGRAGMGGRFQREGLYVSGGLIHVVTWQKPTRSKAIILQLKINVKVTALIPSTAMLLQSNYLYTLIKFVITITLLQCQRD